MATTTNYGWTTPDDTALVKDGASAIRTLGSSVDTTTKNLHPETTLGDIAYRSSSANVKTRLPLGTAGQVLRVNSGATAPEWATTADQTPLTTKGDLFTFDTADARLGVGANGTILVADSSEATGLKWQAPAGGGKVLQVVQFTTSTASTVTSTTFTDTNITLNITPSLATSKVMVIASCATQYFTNGAGLNQVGMGFRLKRNSTVVFDPSGNGGEGEYITDSTNSYKQMSAQTTFSYLDSPATTSATTYTIAIRNNASTNTAKTSPDSRESSLILMEIGA